MGVEVYYNVWRWYETGTGRYVSADPLSLFGGPQLYGYGQGNPNAFTDPLGLRTLGFGGSFCVDPACSCNPGPIDLKDEDSNTVVPLPAAGKCTAADAVYGPDGTIKIRDFGWCFLRCNSDGSAQYISCSPVPPIESYPCSKPLPAGWPENPNCS